MLYKDPAYKNLLRFLDEGDPRIRYLLNDLFVRVLPHSPYTKKVFQVYKLLPDQIVRHMSEFKLMRNWIKAAISNREEWIEETTPTGIPLRFLDIRNISELNICINHDGAARRDQLARQFNDVSKVQISRAELVRQNQIEIVREYPDGKAMVRLLTRFALDRESFFMSHCIGHGAYDINLTWHGYEYYSLWGKNDKPHASIEVVGNCVTQCKGKQNKPPAPKYMPYILEFVNESEWDVGKDTRETGLFRQNGYVRSFYPSPV